MSQAKVLTESFLRSLQASGDRREIWDAGHPGFGIRIGATGEISFQYVYRFEGRSRRYTLGKYPLLSLNASRAAYDKAAIALSKGIDPAAEGARRKQEQKIAPTLSAAIDQYIERYAKVHKKTWAEDERQLRKDVIPRLGDKLAKEITRKEINSLLDAKMDANSPVAANRLRSLLSKLFNWLVERGEIETSPCIGISKPAKEVSRERVLLHSEIHPLWSALDEGWKVGMHLTTRRALQFMLLTGQRKGEVLQMRWENIVSTNDGYQWSIPASNTKNGKPHRVPLLPEAMKILQSLKTNLREDSLPTGWCFPSPANLAQHISLTAPDHALRNELSKKDSALFGLKHFTPHDLRRTVATALSALGYSRLIVQKVLNHSDPSVTAIYDRNNYDTEKKQALAKWEDMLIAATWPAGKDINRDTGDIEYFWDFEREWDRMVP